MHDRGMQFGSTPGGTSRRGWRLGGRAESIADEFDDGGVVGLAKRDVALPGWRDHLAAVLDDARHLHPGEVDISLDASADSVGDPGVEFGEERGERMQDAPVEACVGADRFEPADSVGADSDERSSRST